MSSGNDILRTRGIISLMSYAGLCGAVIDSKGNLVAFTPKFEQLTGVKKTPAPLSEIFRTFPTLPITDGKDEFPFTLRATGTILTGKHLENFDGLSVIVFNQKDNQAGSRVSILPHVVYASTDLVFQFDSETRVYYVNDNAEEITGYTKEDFLTGRIHPLDIVHPDDKAKLKREFDQIFVNHKSVEGSEHRIVKKNGDIIHVMKSWYSLIGPGNKFGGVIGLNRDITDEKLLRERLQLFRSAFEQATDAIIITRVDGTIIEVNDAFTKIYGYSREETLGKTTALIQSKHSSHDFYKELWNSLEKFSNWKGEIINRRKDGVETPIWLSITPILHDGEKIGYMGIESALSERKNLEQQIIQTEKLSTIGQLAAGMAHEIGTPLNIISGNAEFMLLDMKSGDKGYQELSTIIAQTRRITKLMRQLLDYAKPKLLSLQAADVNAILNDVLDFVRPQFKKSGMEISTRLDARSPKIYGDPAQLYQVFLNTIMNALHAMAKGGKLEAATLEEKESDSETRVIVTIKDTGNGILPENLRKLFTPFFTTKEPGKGTGLGLAVTRRIIEEHKGSIQIESEVGKGTVVTIKFNSFIPQTDSQMPKS